MQSKRVLEQAGGDHTVPQTQSVTTTFLTALAFPGAGELYQGVPGTVKMLALALQEGWQLNWLKTALVLQTVKVLEAGLS